jgi:hypothetical protein
MTTVGEMKNFLDSLPEAQPIMAVIYTQRDAAEYLAEDGIELTDEVMREAVRLFDKFAHEEVWEDLSSALSMAIQSQQKEMES